LKVKNRVNLPNSLHRKFLPQPNGTRVIEQFGQAIIQRLQCWLLTFWVYSSDGHRSDVEKKGSGDKSYHTLFHISPFFAPRYGLLHFLGQFADIGGTAHVKGLRDPFLRHAGLFRDDVR
jgi:hypothetical protein